MCTIAENNVLHLLINISKVYRLSKYSSSSSRISRKCFSLDLGQNIMSTLHEEGNLLGTFTESTDHHQLCQQVLEIVDIRFGINR